MENVNSAWEILAAVAGIGAVLFYAPYLIRRGWGKGQHVTKKVCDRCFRDIEQYNKVLKQQSMTPAPITPNPFPGKKQNKTGDK